VVILALRPTVWGAVLSLFVLALGEIIQAPRYYEYISRLAPPGEQALTWALLFCHRNWIADRWLVWRHAGPPFGEVTHQPARIWWTVTAVGLATAAVLWIYDKLWRRARLRQLRWIVARRTSHATVTIGHSFRTALLIMMTTSARSDRTKRLLSLSLPFEDLVANSKVTPIYIADHIRRVLKDGGRRRTRKKCNIFSRKKCGRAAGTPPNSESSLCGSGAALFASGE